MGHRQAQDLVVFLIEANPVDCTADNLAAWREAGIDRISIGVLSLASLAMIFIVLYSRYRSTALSLIIMGGIPLALIGSVAALKITGQPLSVASMIGFITLAGISARNGILKISHYINLAIHEDERFGTGLIVRGSMERLSPVLMTALCAGLALTPLLIGADEPGREILHPVAVTIFGGLLSATILDTVVTPILFLMFGEKPLQRAGRKLASRSPSQSRDTGGRLKQRALATLE